MKAAIIGLGSIGKLHAQVISEYGTLEAVCDISESRLEKFSGAKQYTDYVKMLDEVHPDVVHICTPHHLHADMVIDALKRGIHVLCEKPLCIKPEDIDRILAAEKASSAQLGVCLQNRYNSANLAAKAYLAGKTVEMGVGQVSWNRDEAYYNSADWRGKWETEGGGVLINQALHTLDLMQWLCGMPQELAAAVSNLRLQGTIEVEDTASILCKGDADFTFYATVGATHDCPVEITLQAEGEFIKIMPKYVVFGDRMERYEEKWQPRGKACYGCGHEALISDFYDCIKTGRKFSIDGAEGAKVVKLILAAYRSNNQWVCV